MSHIHLTDHADAQLRQRGTKLSAVLVLQHVADRRIHLGDGACIISVSRNKAQQLRLAGFASTFVDRLERLSLVLSEDTGAVLNVLKGALSGSYCPRGHRHRRGGRRHWEWAAGR